MKTLKLKVSENALQQLYSTVQVYSLSHCDFNISGKVVALYWDPKGPRFAVIQGEQGRTDVSFFKIGEKILPIGKTLVNKKCNCIKWSPLGLSFFKLIMIPSQFSYYYCPIIS